jgi:hypothetical protein
VNQDTGRAKRSTRETYPVPCSLLPSSGPNPRVRVWPRLDLWLRLHPQGPELGMLAFLVLALILAACL